MVLQDDMGWNDIGFNNPSMLGPTGNMTALAKEGIVLTNHLVHYHCSPTRRSFLSGRLAFHHSEGLSDVAGDDLDLRWTLISGKLKNQGYKTHWLGKVRCTVVCWLCKVWSY
jgi:arylsulfatase A-like enzyme